MEIRREKEITKMVLKKLGIEKGVNLTQPKLSAGFFITLILIVVMMTGAIEIGRYFYGKAKSGLSGVTETVEEAAGAIV